MVPIVVAIVTIPMYLTTIGSAKFGLLSIAFLILGYFGIFDLGLGRAVAHRIAGTQLEKGANQPGIVGTAVICNSVLGLVGGLVLWLSTFVYFQYFLDADDGLRGQMLSAIPALALSMPVTALTGVLSGALEGRGRFAVVNIATTIAAVTFHLLPLALALGVTRDLQWLIAAACSARILGVLMLIALCLREFGPRLEIVRKEIAPLFRFGGWIAVSSLVGPLMIITDRFVIGALIGPVAVAVYTIPFEISARTATIPQALGRALFPQISAEADPLNAVQLGRDSSFALGALMTPLTILGIFAMPMFLDLWLKNYDAKSVVIGQLILTAFWVNAITYVPLTLIVGQGRPKVVALIHCMELLPYLAVLYVLTNWLGVEGAALAFMLRCLVDYFLLGRLSGLLMHVWITQLLFAGLVGSALAAAIIVRPGYIDSVWLGAGFTLAALGVAFLLGRDQLLEIARKLRIIH